MTDIEEITWETFDERTRIWFQVLSNVPVEAVVRMLRLDLNTGVVTLRGVGADKVLGVISTDDDIGVGRSFFVTLKGEPLDPVPYESGYARSIALAVYHSALHVLVGDVPLVWDDYDGLTWITDNLDEVFEMHRVRWQICYRLRRQFVDDPDGLINFIEKYRAGKTDEEREAARPVMVTNDGPEPKDVGEHA